MFPVITKDKYVLFAAVEGFSKLPSNSLNNNKEINNSNAADIEINDNKLKKVEGIKAGPDSRDGGAIKNSFVCCCLLLEDQIVKNLKLDKLGVYNLKLNTTEEMIKDINIINLTSKSFSVKSGFISYWKASFYSTSEVEQKDFKKSYTLSFITPSYIDKKAIEKHLLSNVAIRPTSNSPTFKYTRASLEKIAGRKYKI